MKSYCDLSQCKVLMEFLPHESADMIWYGIYCGTDGKYHLLSYEDNELGAIAINKDFCKSLFKLGDEYVDWLPCWSLTALLSVIKSVNGNTYTLTGTLDGGATIEFDEVTNVMYQREEIIDAVYEMVIWLHKEGVL